MKHNLIKAALILAPAILVCLTIKIGWILAMIGVFLCMLFLIIVACLIAYEESPK